jgi:signal peptidase I
MSEQNSNPAQNRPPERTAAGKKSQWLELLQFAVITALIVIPIRIFIAQPFLVRGSSMEPTFENGDYLVVDQISYRFQKPERGDVIIFRPPVEPKRFLIKRVIGLPGETVEINDTDTVIVGGNQSDGAKLKEPYVKKPSGGYTVTKKLAADEYFVMGDNRGASADSRIWGALPAKMIVGRPIIRLYPFPVISIWPGIKEIGTN